MSSCADFFEKQGLNYLDYNVHEMGSMFAFHDVFPTAIEILPDCAYEYFHWLDGYEFLPFKHLLLFKYEPGSRFSYLGMPLVYFLV